MPPAFNRRQQGTGRSMDNNRAVAPTQGERCPVGDAGNGAARRRVVHLLGPDAVGRPPEGSRAHLLGCAHGAPCESQSQDRWQKSRERCSGTDVWALLFWIRETEQWDARLDPNTKEMQGTARPPRNSPRWEGRDANASANDEFDGVHCLMAGSPACFYLFVAPRSGETVGCVADGSSA